MKVVIVGGVAGGASAAARLRRLDEAAEILLFERGGYISYANCGLPYYIGGVITEEDELLLQTPESFYQRFRVDVRVYQEVTEICKAEKKVRVRDLKSRWEYEESYDRLILSPGAAPFVPDIPGKELPRVLTLRDVEDMRRIRRLVEAGLQEAVVIGGGFIGLELSENLVRQGIRVSVVEAAPQILAPFDEEMAGMIQSRMEEAGIAFYLNSQAVGIEEQGDRYEVALADGRRISGNFVLCAIGVRPDSRLAREAGAAVNERGGIVTDPYLETSETDIFAVGDAVQIRNPILNDKGMIPLAGPANKQGRTVAGNLNGKKEIYEGAIGSSVIQIFDQTAACTGVNERVLNKAGVPYEKIYLMPMSHAGYYPGGSQMALKFLFSPEGKILGAQCIGREGVEKRIDVIAAAIHFNGTAADLAKLDLCYAPPYSSAKDPVNFAGYVAQNVQSGLSPLWHWHERGRLEKEGAVLVDVRTQEEYAEGHLPNSRNIPVDELRERLRELDVEKPVYVYCQVGIRGYIAQRILIQKGYQAYNLSGGYGFYCKIKGVRERRRELEE